MKAYRWYGGKLRMVNILNFLIPEHKIYAELFMGAASLYLNHPRSKVEILNDLDADVSGFWKTLADRELGKKLVEQLCNLKYEKAVFDEALKHRNNHFRGLDDVQKAVAIYVLISQSFNATRRNFSKTGYRDTETYQTDIKGNLPEVYERLEGVEVLNENGIDLVERFSDNAEAFLFLDPPYRHDLRGKGATSAYACELPHCEQVRLLKTIRHAKCKILLCGYKSEKNDLYDTYLLPHGWKCYRLCEVVKACQVSRTVKDMAQEYVWVNYELPKLAKFVINTKECSSL